ncbi:hypothetical protein PQX77_022128 [Marasmius sp. AFHP31]|nr:hypothetical protein PQX77_022128 [Marasmius sp. AFHP31]
METAVGNLGRERKQDRFPYMNIAQRAILRAHVNALAAEFPEKLLNIDSDESLPQGAKEVGGGYVLLRPREDAVQPTTREERDAIAAFWCGKSWPNVDGWLGSGGGVKRWGRMRLPNGQICRSTWSERNFSGCRKTCNMKIVSVDGSIWFGEVRFYFNLSFGIAEQHALCLVSLYTQSDEDLALHQESLKTIYRCSGGGNTSLRVLDVRNIKALVAMVPNFEVDLDGNINIPVNHWILVEKPFLETGARCGVVDEDKEDEGEDE